jgi:hypothetical protein
MFYWSDDARSSSGSGGNKGVPGSSARPPRDGGGELGPAEDDGRPVSSAATEPARLLRSVERRGRRDGMPSSRLPILIDRDLRRFLITSSCTTRKRQNICLVHPECFLKQRLTAACITTQRSTDSSLANTVLHPSSQLPCESPELGKATHSLIKRISSTWYLDEPGAHVSGATRTGRLHTAELHRRPRFTAQRRPGRLAHPRRTAFGRRALVPLTLTDSRESWVIFKVVVGVMLGDIAYDVDVVRIVGGFPVSDEVTWDERESECEEPAKPKGGGAEQKPVVAFELETFKRQCRYDCERELLPSHAP